MYIYIYIYIYTHTRLSVAKNCLRSESAPLKDIKNYQPVS